MDLRIPERPPGPVAPMGPAQFSGPLAINPCPDGYQLQQVEGVFMCVPVGMQLSPNVARSMLIQAGAGGGGGPTPPVGVMHGGDGGPFETL